MTALASYSTGTISVAADGTNVAGVGPLWRTAGNAKPGDLFQSGHFCVFITDVPDDTHLTITPWPGAALSGATYSIWKVSQQRIVGAGAADDVDKIVAALNANGFMVFVPPSLTAPDPSLGEENQTAIQPTSGKMWVMSGGVWTYLGIYRGFKPRGAYDNAATYYPGDYMTSSGSSYVWINETPGSGHAPPNPTYWQVLAEKGEKGEPGTPGTPGTPGAPGTPGLNGSVYGGSSTSSIVVAVGHITLATQTGLAYLPGARVRVSSSATPAIYLEGIVSAYDPATGVLSFDADKSSGSGTLASWNLNIAGEPGSADFITVRKFLYPAKAGQTTFFGADAFGRTLVYTPGFITVVLNGSVLTPNDFTATNGTSVVLARGTNDGDSVYIDCSLAYNPADALSISQNGADILDKTAFRKNIGLASVMQSYLSGLVLSTAGAVTTFSVAPGVAADSTNTDMMTLNASITKTTASFAVGSGNGALLDTGSIAVNTWYHAFLLKQSNGTTDVGVSVNVAGSLPSGYVALRRIGAMKTNASGQWLKFVQNGDEFIWDVPVNDVVNFNGTTPALRALASVPPGLKVNALLYVLLNTGTSGAGRGGVFSPDMTSTITAVVQYMTNGMLVGTANYQTISQANVRTNASAQVLCYVENAAAGLWLTSYGWIDRRGRDG
ncbi:hypothetical protein AC629_22820 [Bradyrhizobium sp. NAS80.1]|uniref:hypothetical protein n=1 Tax=Bradyrhizobium sp. NAS80.1 TaxID=1680159 RepID=UPI000963BCC7|nr:hypothetical protein [Bradyrhizobium sp. NAS80.1]OKO83377.1 hypothetical protein AC629_22820 [Bradyrhizobium sp. NAS80.1]